MWLGAISATSWPRSVYDRVGVGVRWNVQDDTIGGGRWLPGRKKLRVGGSRSSVVVKGMLVIA